MAKGNILARRRREIPRKSTMKKKTITEIIMVVAVAAAVWGPSLLRIAKERLKVWESSSQAAVEGIAG